MKYILFIAMDLALYPFLLVLFIGKCIRGNTKSKSLVNIK